MTKDEHIRYWLDSARHDLEAAENLFSNQKYDWALFIGHLVIEKALKAHYVQENDNNNPPKLHDLVRLAEQTSLILTEDQKLFLDEVNDFNIEARYPDYKQALYKKCTPDYARHYFDTIKEFYAWLTSLLM